MPFNRYTKDYQNKIVSYNFPERLWQDIEERVWYREIKYKTLFCPNKLIQAIRVLRSTNKDFQILDLYYYLRFNNVINELEDQQVIIEDLKSLCKSILILKHFREIVTQTYATPIKTINLYRLNPRGVIIKLLQKHTNIEIGKVIRRNPNDLIIHHSHPRSEVLMKLSHIPVYIHKGYAEWLDIEVMKRYESFLRYPTMDPGKKVSLETYTTYVDILKVLRKESNNYQDPVYISYKCDFRGRYYPMFTIVSQMSTRFIRVIFYTEKNDMNSSNISDLTVIKAIDPEISSQSAHVRNDEFINLYRDRREKFWFLKCYQKRGTIPAIQLDAVCSGYQHYSILTNHHELGKYVKLTTNKDDSNDLYTMVGSKWYDSLNDHQKNIVKESHNDIREGVKKVVMTKLYGLTRWGCFGYLKDSLRYFVTIDIANALYDTIDRFLGRYSSFRKLFGKLCYMDPTHSVDIYGLKVDIAYYRKYNMEFRVRYINSKLHFNRKVKRGSLDINKTINNAFVNLIHSLDAIHITLMIMKSPVRFLPIHDCLCLSVSRLGIVKPIPSRMYNKLYRDINVLRRIIIRLDVPKEYKDELLELVGKEPLYATHGCFTSRIWYLVSPVLPLGIETLYQVQRSDRPVRDTRENPDWDDLLRLKDYRYLDDDDEKIHLPTGPINNPYSPTFTNLEIDQMLEDPYFKKIWEDEREYNARPHPVPLDARDVTAQAATVHNATHHATSKFVKYQDLHRYLTTTLNNVKRDPNTSRSVEGMAKIHALEKEKHIVEMKIQEWQRTLRKSPIVKYVEDGEFE